MELGNEDRNWPTQMEEFPLLMSKKTHFDIEAGDTTVQFKFTLYQRTGLSILY